MRQQGQRIAAAAMDGRDAGQGAAAPLAPPGAPAARLRGHADLARENGGLVPWCGPAVVALATGYSLAGASQLMREIAPQWYPEDAPVVTAYWRDLLGALDRVGIAHAPFAPNPTAPGGRPSLLRMLRQGGPDGAPLGAGWFLLRVTGHFLLLRSHGFGLGAVHDNRHSGALVTHRSHGQRRISHASRLLDGPLLAHDPVAEAGSGPAAAAMSRHR